VSNNFSSPIVTAALAEVSPTGHGKMLSEVIAEYIQDKELTGAWRPRTKDENSRMYRLFMDLLKISNGRDDIAVKAITRPLMQEYVKLLKRVPSNMNKP
jgi:signal transduction histidine kinase